MKDLADRIFAKAEKVQDEAVTLMRRLIEVPAPSHQEEARLMLLRDELDRLGAADRHFIDSYGNLCWVVGQGERTLMSCSHLDTVTPAPEPLWQRAGRGAYDSAFIQGHVEGLGAVSPLAGVVAQVFASKLIRAMGLNSDATLLSVSTVGAEANPGGGQRWIFNEGVRSNLYQRPEVVLLSEPTGDADAGPLGIYRGQRGVMKIKLTFTGDASHGGAPRGEGGAHAIMAMNRVLNDLEALQKGDGLGNDPFLGRGALTVTRVADQSPSDHTTAPWCQLTLDRRLTFGESRPMAIAQLLNLPSVRALGDAVTVQVHNHESQTWRQYQVTDSQCWEARATPENHPAVKAAVSTWRAALAPRAHQPRYEGLLPEQPRLGRWRTHSEALGVPKDIPIVGLGAGDELQTHTPRERLDTRELVAAIAFLALYPTIYIHQTRP